MEAIVQAKFIFCGLLDDIFVQVANLVRDECNHL